MGLLHQQIVVTRCPRICRGANVYYYFTRFRCIMNYFISILGVLDLQIGWNKIFPSICLLWYFLASARLLSALLSGVGYISLQVQGNVSRFYIIITCKQQGNGLFLPNTFLQISSFRGLSYLLPNVFFIPSVVQSFSTFSGFRLLYMVDNVLTISSKHIFKPFQPQNSPNCC